MYQAYTNPNIAIGEVCDLTDPCIDGANCEPSDGGGRRCEASHVAGETCDESRDCATGLYCDATKKCAQKKPAGSACELTMGMLDACYGPWGDDLCVQPNACKAIDAVAITCN